MPGKRRATAHQWRAPRTRSINAAASAGGVSPRQATWPSGRTNTSLRSYNAPNSGLIDRDDVERHAARLGSLDQRGPVRRIRAETQQREAAPEQIEGRAAVGEPGVRRAPARMAGLR